MLSREGLPRGRLVALEATEVVLKPSRNVFANTVEVTACLEARVMGAVA